MSCVFRSKSTLLSIIIVRPARIDNINVAKGRLCLRLIYNRVGFVGSRVCLIVLTHVSILFCFFECYIVKLVLFQNCFTQRHLSKTILSFEEFPTKHAR
jgi:hypothetical protein